MAAIYDVNKYGSMTNPTGINLFGQDPRTTTNKMLFNNAWDQVLQTPTRQAASSPTPSTTQTVQPKMGAGTSGVPSTNQWWRKPLTVYYNNGIGSLSPMKSSTRLQPPTQEAETQRKGTGGWQGEFAEDVRRSLPPAPQGTAGDYSYIQLANMLDSGTAANFGMTDEQVVAAMNAIKGKQ